VLINQWVKITLFRLLSYLAFIVIQEHEFFQVAVISAAFLNFYLWQWGNVNKNLLFTFLAMQLVRP
jgi:hypothetical protein